jgi:hypothetical protein
MSLHRTRAPARGDGHAGRGAAVLGALSVVLVLVAAQSVGRSGFPADGAALLQAGSGLRTDASLEAEIQQAEQLIAPGTAGPSSMDEAELGAVRETRRYGMTDSSLGRQNAGAAGAQVDALTDDELRASIVRLEGDLRSPVKKGALAHAKRAAAAKLKKTPDAGARGFRSLLLNSLAAIEGELAHQTEGSRVQKAVHEMSAIQRELGGLRSRIHEEQRAKQALQRRLRDAQKQRVAHESTTMKTQAAMQKDLAALLDAERKISQSPKKHDSHAPFPPTVAVYVQQAPQPQLQYIPEQYFAAPQPHVQGPSPQLSMHFPPQPQLSMQQQLAPLQAQLNSHQLAVTSTSPFEAARAAFKAAVASFSGDGPRVRIPL